MQRQTTKGNINPDEEETVVKPTGTKDLSKEQFLSFVSILWTGVKIVLILFVVFPFIDKIRHKDYFSRAINFINEYDIGCKPCICPIMFNRTLIRTINSEEDSKGSL